MTSAPAIRPSIPNFLTALTNDFIDHHFDLRVFDAHDCKLAHLPGLLSLPMSERGRRYHNFSHALPRRLTAEELMDALSIATGSRAVFKDVPKDFHGGGASRLQSGRWADSSTYSAGRSGISLRVRAPQ